MRSVRPPSPPRLPRPIRPRSTRCPRTGARRIRAAAAVLAAFGSLAVPAARAAALAPGPDDVAAALAEGDVHYERRADGARGGTADPREADLAIQAYRRALAASPDDLDALSRLLRALNFRGAFCGADLATRKRLFDEGRLLGLAAVARMEKSVEGRSAADRIAALRGRRGAAGAYYWTAACLGQWALARGTFASARSGVGGRLRDFAETVIALDAALEEGGGYRVLGRLHHQAPHIPLITGWVSKTKGVEYLRKSYALGPTNPVTWFFLGEALLDGDASQAEEGRRFLRRCIDTPPRADYVVESLSYAEQARARLAADGR
jgi:tetratricopeptide (TPR) repeat protein